MKIADILLLDFDTEIASVRRILERIPDDKPDYKPHDKSMLMGKLAMHVAVLPHFGLSIVSTPGMDLATTKFPDMTYQGREAMLDALHSSAAECRAALAAASDEDLMKPWRFSWGDKVISEAPRAATFRLMFFNHMIHHRAQLGVYLRLNEVAVPGLYGPSADEPF